MKNTEEKLFDDFFRSKQLAKLYFREDRLWIIAGFTNLADEEIELFQEQNFTWKAIRIASTSYLCFSPSGYSWNEIALLNADKTQNLEELLDYPNATIPIRFIGIRTETREVFTDRDFTLDFFNTEKLITAIKAQQFLKQKEAEDLDFLGDPTALIRAFQSNNLPDILTIDVDKFDSTVEITVNALPKREFKEPRARWILRHYENMAGTENLRIYADILQQMAEAKIEPEWKYCLIPVEVVQKVEGNIEQSKMLSELKKLGAEHLAEEYLNKLPESYYSAIFAALMINWRYSKGIYNFDNDVLESIYLASLPLGVDATVFMRLPEYCIYAKTPKMTDWNKKPIQGFFAMAEEVPVDEDLAETINEFFPDSEEKLETDANLYLLIDGGSSDESRNERTNIIKIPLHYGTLGECLEEIELVESRKDEREPDTAALIEWVVPYLNQLLYLCSEEPEIEHSKQKELKPATENVQNTKKGLRIYVPSRSNEWLCGWRTGSFIKEQKIFAKELEASIQSTKTVRSHLRRAHWHTFYAGKRNSDEREIRLKWLQMIKVNFDGNDTDKLPTVIKKVK